MKDLQNIKQRFGIIGNFEGLNRAIDIAVQVAPTDLSVLITGESGTGKEVVANSVHHLSKRRDKPLIKVNCGAIPEGIIESELFGHQKGAFTGAVESRPGYFEMADKGSIFLDEIGELPVSTQVKFLRVLETGEFMRVGGSSNVHTDARAIAATNKDLAKEVFNKNFREDLYFRLKSINLHIPPLRERKSDIKILFDFFIEKFCKENNITFKGIDEEAMEFIINYVWYGNARELKNFCESIIVLYPEQRLTLFDVKKHLQPVINETRQLPVLQTRLREQYDIDLILRALFELKTDIIDIKNKLKEIGLPDKHYVYSNNDFVIHEDELKNMNFEEIEKEILKYYLQLHRWNINSVSKALGQSERNIYRKIKKFKIEKNGY